jgi:hypothetical protein
MVSADQLHEEINERLARGQDLIDQSTGDKNALKERRQEYYTWTEYNEALLRRSFDIAQPADEYIRWLGIVVGGAPDPLHVQWADLHDDIRGKMRRLRNLSNPMRNQAAVFLLGCSSVSIVVSGWLIQALVGRSGVWAGGGTARGWRRKRR